MSPDNPAGNGGGERRLPVVLAVVAAVVLVLAILWATDREDPIAAPTTTQMITTSTSSGPSSTTTSRARSTTSTTAESETRPDPQPATLGDLVPGFDGSLHALIGDSNRQLVEVPAEQTSSPRSLGSEPLRFVTSFSFDASNEFVAFLQVDQSEEDRYELQVWSRRSHYLLEDVNVLSYQWHPVEPRLLAAVTVVDPRAPAELQVITFDDSGHEAYRTPITHLGQHHVLHGWGEWGFLVGHYDQLFETHVTTVLDETGEVVWQADDMTVLDASHDYLLVQQHNEANANLYSVMSPTDPSDATPLPLPDGVDGLTGFGWSPDQRLAVLYPTEGRDSSLRIYNSSQTAFTDIPLEGWRIWDLKWGPNSRFVVMPGTDDAGRHVAIICDTSAQTISYVDFNDWVQWADLS